MIDRFGFGGAIFGCDNSTFSVQNQKKQPVI